MAHSLQVCGGGVSFQVFSSQSFCSCPYLVLPRTLPGCVHTSLSKPENFWEVSRTIVCWLLLPPFGPSQILLVSFPKQHCIPYWSLLLWDNSCKWVSSNLTKAAVSVKGSRTTHPRETSYSRYFLGIGVEVSFLCKYFPLGVGIILPHKGQVSLHLIQIEVFHVQNLLPNTWGEGSSQCTETQRIWFPVKCNVKTI